MWWVVCDFGFSCVWMWHQLVSDSDCGMICVCGFSSMWVWHQLCVIVASLWKWLELYAIVASLFVIVASIICVTGASNCQWLCHDWCLIVDSMCKLCVIGPSVVCDWGIGLSDCNCRINVAWLGHNRFSASSRLSCLNYNPEISRTTKTG